MIQPLIIPLPNHGGLPLQFRPPSIRPNQVNQQEGNRPEVRIIEGGRMQPEVRIIQLSHVSEPQDNEVVMRSPHGPPQPHQLPPNPLMQHIARQIIAQHEMAAAAHR